MQWQHGSFQISSSGSLQLVPISVDGRQLTSDPCNSQYSVMTRENTTETFQVRKDVKDSNSVFETDWFTAVRTLDRPISQHSSFKPLSIRRFTITCHVSCVQTADNASNLYSQSNKNCNRHRSKGNSQESKAYARIGGLQHMVTRPEPERSMARSKQLVVVWHWGYRARRLSVYLLLVPT